MPSLKKWLQKKLPEKKEESSLPFLPVKRPNILTPSPSRENLVSSMDNYGVFQRLPLEIRRAILIEAFGGRSLHMHLSYDYPLIRKSKPQTTTTTHCGLGSNLTRNSKRRESWQWFGCVCHRPDYWPEKSPYSSPFPNMNKIGTVDLKSRPDQDVCLSGVVNDGVNSECGPPGEEDKCFIGVMGWLLACRQSYVDGIDVLFTTNTFHLEGDDLLQHLPGLLLPQRLRSIQSLEMLWFKRRTQDKSTSSSTQPLWANHTKIGRASRESVLHTLCQMVPQALPHVRQVTISLECIVEETHKFAGPTESRLIPDPPILGPIEDMIRALGPGREFNVAIQLRLWNVLKSKYGALYGPNFRIETHNTCIEGRFWKLLGTGDELGYWVCSGRFYQSQESVML
ncbi:hypothetical protein V495_01787 [Pseudogymnoascus sp. VKM F-4514 (FW-929)]|nr:hypothetical protein V495_01787 [Pseudogymnoascus sp. VKM F-4514 (FW-929)]